MALFKDQNRNTRSPVLDADRVDTEKRRNFLQLLSVIVSVWLLGYYLVPKTFFERVSPGGLVMEASGIFSLWLVYTATSILCVVAILSLIPLPGIQRVANYPPVWLTAAIYCFSLLASWATSATDIEQERSIVSLLTAFSVGVIAVRTVNKPQYIVASITLIALVQCLYAIIYQRQNINQMISGTVSRAGGTFADPNQLYLLMLIALPFAIAGLLQEGKNLVRFSYIIACSIEFAVIMSTHSRGGLLGLAVAITTLSFIISGSKKFTAVVLLCLLILFGINQSVRMAGPVNTASTNRSNASRTLLWQEGWKNFLNHPLTGNGINSFQSLVVDKKANHNVVVHAIDEPKNLFLYWLDEIGVGAAFLFAFFAWAIFATVRQSLPNRFSAATAAAWAGFLVTGLVDTPFGPPERYVGNCCFGMLLCVTILLPKSFVSEVRTSAT